jgi:hypothetical protein
MRLVSMIDLRHTAAPSLGFSKKLIKNISKYDHFRLKKDLFNFLSKSDKMVLQYLLTSEHEHDYHGCIEEYSIGGLY